VSTTQLNDIVRLEDDYGRVGFKGDDEEFYDENELPTDINNVSLRL